MLGNAFRMEMTKVFRRRMTWVLAGILVLLVAGLYLVIFAAALETLSDPGAAPGTMENLRGMLCWPQSFSTLLGLTGGAGLGGLMVVVLAGTMTGGEYSWRTTHLWLSRGLPRSTFLLAKYAALGVAALLVVLAAMLTGLLLTAWFTQHLNGSLGLAELDLVELGLSILRTVYTILPYAGLTFLIAVLTRSTAAAVAGGLAYAMLEDVLVQLMGLAGGAWVEIARWAPGSLVAALMQTNARLIEVDLGTGVNAGMPGAWAAAGGITLYVLVFLGLSLWVFRRQNLTG